MKKSFLIIGLGTFGLNLTQELSKNDCDILVIDKKRENITLVSDYISNCAICDSTKKRELEDVGAAQADHAIICIGGDLEATIMTVINLKALNVKEITVRAENIEYKEIFKTLGATNVIIPEEASAISLANRLANAGILDYYNIKDDYSIVQLKASTNHTQTLDELKIRQNHDVSIIGIIRNDKFFIPQASDIISKDDILLIIGIKKQIKKFAEFLNS